MSFESFPRFKQFSGRNILAVDYGTKVIGLANWCPGREPFPCPYGKIIYQNDLQAIKEIGQVCEDEAIEVLIIGLPLHADGSDSEMTKKVRAFKELLLTQIKNLEVHLQDETLTSYEAKERMRTSARYDFKVDPKQIDALAASIILEDFIRTISHE